MDALTITPGDAFIALGYVGGPFAPENKTYTLFNRTDNDLHWEATASESWVFLSDSGGMLGGGASTTVTVGLDTNALSVGDHDAVVVFSHLNSDVSRARPVSLTILPIPGVIQVTDSIPPDDDLAMYFGSLARTESRTEHITVTNASLEHPLVINGISRSGSSYFSLQNLPAMPKSLAPLESVVFDVVYTPKGLGAHAATAFINTNDAHAPVVEVALSGTGVYDYLVITPADDAHVSGPAGGPFSPDTFVYTLTNNGATTLEWTAAKSPDLVWAALSDLGGTLEVDESNTLVLTVNAAADGLSAGVHTGAISVVNLDTDIEHTRQVRLEARPVNRFIWDAVPSPQYVHRPFTTTIRAVDLLGAPVKAYTGPVTFKTNAVLSRTIGAGSNTWNYPLATFARTARTQVIYLQSEIVVAGPITGLALNVAAVPEQTLGNWTIRMKHTTLAVHP